MQKYYKTDYASEISFLPGIGMVTILDARLQLKMILLHTLD
jgi:hypothetical protein